MINISLYRLPRVIINCQDPRNNASIHRGCTCCASSTTRLYSMDHDDKFVTRVRKRSCEMIQRIDVQQQRCSITANTSLVVVVVVVVVE
uniref:Uncharacterized protein n=1 Tax=Trichogramma kaykai TaxID=54128 RepID=A0ABD2XHB0_9HYME